MPTATIAGRWNRPELHLRFHPSEPHASAPDKTLKEWVESYIVGQCKGQAFWRRSAGGYWLVVATGADADRKLRLAGFTLDFSETAGTDLSNVIGVDELVPPLTRLSSDGSTALVLPRLLGFERTKELLGIGARWNRDLRRFEMPVAAALRDGAPVPGINWQPDIIAAARESIGRIVVAPQIARAAASAASAKDVLEMDAADIDQLISVVGDIPDWFGLDLFPFQRIGAIACASGHFGLFDEPGLGKTRQALAAAAILGAKRTLITSLPVALTHWSREVEESRLHTLGGRHPDGEIVIIRSGRKEPETLPEHGVVITSDSLLAHRPALRARLAQWAPEATLYDEAHRGKTFESTRSQAMLSMGVATARAPVAITGTPLFANPAELAPLLEFTGHLAPVFGGVNAYLERYCKHDYFGNLVPNKANLGELREILREQVWVRRRKHEVLPDLPKTLIQPKWVDVPLTGYRKAHADVIEKLKWWLAAYRRDHNNEDPDDEVIRDYAAAQVGMVSQLRRAGGLAKVEAIVADIRAHVQETTVYEGGKRIFTRPLIVWAHHIEVSDALADAVPKAVAETGVIRGGIPHAERDRLVAEFQAGNIPVLVCSIAAAGVAITLTASSDMYFAESDWTPANIRQAIDRAERIGQTSEKIFATTYLAPGTLDGRVQEVLKRKSKVLDALYGEGNDVSVDTGDNDIESATEILIGLINDLINGTLVKP